VGQVLLTREEPDERWSAIVRDLPPVLSVEVQNLA
jgi:hypothetical protein